MDNLTFFRALVAAAIAPAAAEDQHGISRDIAARAVSIARAVYQEARGVDIERLSLADYEPPNRRAEAVGGEELTG